MDRVLPIALALASVAVVLWGVARAWSRRRQARRAGRTMVRTACPGPRRTLRAWLLPVWVVYRRSCGYDLYGHPEMARWGADGKRRGARERGRERTPRTARTAGTARTARTARTGSTGRTASTGPTASHAVVCPECGREVRRPRELVDGPAGWRPAGVAAVLVGLAILFQWRPPIPASALVAMAPTRVLLEGESILGGQTPREVREELRRRADDWLLEDDEIRRLVGLLIRDLGDDHLVGNAKAALAQLETLGSLHEDLLVEGLSSPDRQQRMLLAELLRAMQRAGPPPEALLRASVEDLRSDMRRGNLGDAWWFLMAHRQEALPFLVAAFDSDDAQQREAVTDLLRVSRVPREIRDRLLREAVADLGVLGDRSRRGSAFAFLVAGESMEPERADEAAGSERAERAIEGDEEGASPTVPDELLAEAMRRGNRQARFLAAVVAGCRGRTALMEQAVPLLVRQLADNEIEGDAIVAARALWGFGAAAIPTLAPWRELDAQSGGHGWRDGGASAGSADASGADGEAPALAALRAEQRRQAIEYIVARLTTRESRASLQRRYPLARLTLSRTDALDIPLDELRLPWGEFE